MKQKFFNWLAVLSAMALSSCNAPSTLARSPEISLEFSTPYFPITPQPDGQLCWQDKVHPERLEQTWEEFTREIPIVGGLAQGFNADDIHQGYPLGNFTFQVEPFEEIQIDFHTWFPADEVNTDDVPVRILVLLDEKQMVDVMNISPNPYYYDFILHPDDNIEIQINLPPLKPGVHDLVILTLALVDDEPDSVGFIGAQIGRATLIAGNEQGYLERSYSFLNVDPELNVEFDDGPSVLLSLDHTLKVWNWPETRLLVASGADLNFNIFAGIQRTINVDYPDLQQPTQVPFALVAFIDYVQVQVNEEFEVFYGISRNGEVGYVEGALHVPEAPGRHDLLFLRVNYPGFPKCLLIGSNDGLIFADNVGISRVAIDVIEP